MLIPSGAGLGRIQQLLVAKKIIHDDIRFPFLALSMGVTRQLKAGEYHFKGGLTPEQVLNKLAVGEIVYHAVTIPEGVNIFQVCDILAKQSWLEQKSFLRLVGDPAFVAQCDLPGNTLEGYLFPDTYHFSRSQSAEEIIVMMVERFRTVYGELIDSLNPDEPTSGLSRHQQVILASIVEKETGLAEERGRIAAVFLNRLRRNMRLQADPTVIYGLEKFNGNLTRKDLQTLSPYNTYMNKGLPVGPICNPGRDALAAVLQPEQEDFFYFVSRNDGSHYFSKTLTEHNRAVYRLQKKRK